MFDPSERSPSGGERAILVQLDFGEPDSAERLEEIRLLTESAGGLVCAEIGGKRKSPDPRTFAGKGKTEEIAVVCRAARANLAIFNHSLSPVQERNLERELECRVVDRTRLILDIFALRARSAEGKLQVELAQLEHLSTRLVRGWTHLERQRGGIGLRGPGEKQLETDRRLLGKRVRFLKDRLERLSRQRHIQRKARQKNGVLNVSLAGYTNAGKSTLFNALTRADVYAANQLFATLEATSRRLWLPGSEAGETDAASVVLSDTVGFIRNLPHALVEAFKATLEATVEADLILHVIDGASPAREEQIAAVNQTLAEIGAEGTPQIQVWNKIDLTGVSPALERDDYGRICRVKLSARTGAGLQLLRDTLAEKALEKTLKKAESRMAENLSESGLASNDPTSDFMNTSPNSFSGKSLS